MGLLYHVWFSTKGRKVAFDGELRTVMNRILVGIARNNGIRLVETALVADHVHMLVEVDQRQNLAGVIKQAEGRQRSVHFLKVPRTEDRHEERFVLAEGLLADGGCPATKLMS
jgi:REP element-mobilizing transposase RayT